MRTILLLLVSTILSTQFSYGQFPLSLGLDVSGGVNYGIGETYDRGTESIFEGFFASRDYVRPFAKIGVVAFTPSKYNIQANLRLSYTRFFSKTETIYAQGNTGFFSQEMLLEGTFERSFTQYLLDYNIHFRPSDQEFFTVFYGFGLGFYQEKTITNFDPPSDFVFANSYDDVGSENETKRTRFAIAFNLGAQYEFELFRIYGELSATSVGLNVGVGTIIPFTKPS